MGFAAPLAGAALHALVAVSYALESLRKGLVLRRLRPRISSQNLLATQPARLARLVLIAHADAAFTDLVFTPELIRVATREPPPGLGWFKKQLGVATASVGLMAVLELVAGLGSWSALGWLRGLVTVPAVVTALLILDVVLRNRAVPGAADNLSGCSACVELAARLGPRLPDDVELVIVISGAEEAGTGGAQRLAEQVVASGEWTHADTIVLGLDTLSNGALRVLEEGELWRLPIAPLLVEAVAEENAARPRLPPVTRYVVPTGCTDALPFLVRGFPASSLTCIDPGIGAPRHCHRPSDTWSNVDEVQLVASIDFAERLVLRLSRHGGGERRGA